MPANHWAYEFVENAVKEGWIAGYGNGKFGPDDEVSYAQFYTMVVSGFFPEEAECREVTDFSKVRPGDIIVRVNSSTKSIEHVMIAVGDSYINDLNGRWEVPKVDGNINRMVIWNEESRNLTNLYPPESPSNAGNIYYVYTRYPD